MKTILRILALFKYTLMKEIFLTVLVSAISSSFITASHLSLPAIHTAAEEANHDISKKSSLKRTSLRLAASENRISELKMLITAGAPLATCNNQGITPLHVAAFKGHTHCLKTLIAAKVALDVADNEGLTALHLAAAEGHNECLELLIKAGANKHCTTKNGSTALHYATAKGHLNCVETLCYCKGAS